MKKSLLIFAIFILAIGCKKKKFDLSGNSTIQPAEFVKIFNPLKLPANIDETNVSATADTTVLGYKALTQFIPDSVAGEIVQPDKNLVIHPAGKIQATNETYLLIDFVKKNQTQLAVFVFDKKNKFTDYKLLLSSLNNDGYKHSVSINKEPTFTINRDKTVNGQLKFTHIGWSYASGKFMMVLKDDNETPEKTKIIDPIDTLPQENELSGNYTIDDKNFVAIRDGKNANTYLFYLSFSHPDKNCVGELKGEIRVTAPGHAIYQTVGDHCNIDFIFTDEELQLKENGMCGNRHGISCKFNNTYEKRWKTRKRN